MSLAELVMTELTARELPERLAARDRAQQAYDETNLALSQAIETGEILEVERLAEEVKKRLFTLVRTAQNVAHSQACLRWYMEEYDDAVVRRAKKAGRK